MSRSRTIKTLTALFVAMTLGTLVLMVLDTEPISPMAQPLMVVSPPPAGAAKSVYETRRPLQRAKWRYIVVHASPHRAHPPAAACHFLVGADVGGNGKVVATEHWLRQREGGHIGGYWRRNSIGVCLIGDFSRRPPAKGQFRSLVELVNALQGICNVPADRVYLHRDLDARSGSPGAAFPVERFSGRLLQRRP
jgi:hypothetical protein